MNRIFLLFFVLGPLTIPFAGCAGQAQMNMQRALFAQEYRQLEDELFVAYQNMDRLERSNVSLRSQLGQESDDEPMVRPGPRRQSPQRTMDAPNLEPISTEGMQPTNRLPGILQNPQSRYLVRPLPQPVEQAQYLASEFGTRPRKPTGHTTAELPIWRPNR